MLLFLVLVVGQANTSAELNHVLSLYRQGQAKLQSLTCDSKSFTVNRSRGEGRFLWTPSKCRWVGLNTEFTVNHTSVLDISSTLTEFRFVHQNKLNRVLQTMVGDTNKNCSLGLYKQAEDKFILYSSCHLLNDFRDYANSAMTLETLAARSDVVTIANPSAQNNHWFHLHFVPLHPCKAYPQGQFVDVYLDPERDHRITRIQTYYPVFHREFPRTTFTDLFVTDEVTDWQQVGVWLPKRLARWAETPTALSDGTRTEVEYSETVLANLAVNQPIADEDLTTDFPASKPVIVDTGSDPVQVWIWGTDGPEKKYASLQEYSAHLRRESRDSILTRATSFISTLTGWLTVAFWMALIVIVLFFRRRQFTCHQHTNEDQPTA